MDTELIGSSIDLMAYGVGVVFTFLVLLVVAMTLMSTLLRRWFPEPEPVARKARREGVDALTRKIIQAAIDKHRGRK